MAKKSCYIQYHNVAKLGRWPGSDYEEGPKGDWGGIYSKKNMNLIGHKVYMIAGLRQAGKTHSDYFLWCYIDVQNMYVEDGVFVFEGPHYLCREPILLNDVEGFGELKTAAANFSTGLQDRIRLPISAFIMDESKYVPVKDCDALERQCAFEDKYISDLYWRDTKRNKMGKAEYL